MSYSLITERYGIGKSIVGDIEKQEEVGSVYKEKKTEDSYGHEES